MKKLFCFLLCGSILSFLPPIKAGINFGSKDSAIQVGAGATFNVGSSNLTIDGTLKGSSSSSITGNTIAMNHGIIDFDNLAVQMLGTFDPTGADIIRLTGNHTARAEAGTVIDEIRVSGTGNSLHGQPILTFNLTLEDASSELTIAIQNTLNKSIDLNGGVLNLGSELTLADNVNINAPGTIDLKGYRLNLGGINSNIVGDVTLANATDLALHGNIVVTSTWTFSSDARINGNGSIIDLTNGHFKINPGVTLYLEDVTIIGLRGDSYTGSIIFDSNSSSIRSTNSCFEVSGGNYTVSRGRFYIDGETRFLLKDRIWTFNDGPGTDKGVLTINSCLWIDVFEMDICDETPPPGELRCPNTIFVNHVYSQSNVDANVAAGNLVLAHRCRIREVGDLSSATAGMLVGDEVDCDTTLMGNVTIAPNQQIIICGGTCENPITIDGQGAKITFTKAQDGSGNPLPQFIVKRDHAVRLKNITLTCLNDDTFEIRGNACLIIGEDVCFELTTDMVFDGQELNQPENPVRRPGRIIVEGPGNIFKIRGIGGRKRFALNLPDSPSDYIVNGTVVSRSGELLEDPRDPLSELIRVFDLGSFNSVLLEDIEFSGLGFMNFVNRRLTNRLNVSSEVGTPNTALTDVSFALAGNSAFTIDRDTKMNFDIENLTNELLLSVEGTTLFGTVSFFGIAEQNVLSIRHMINDTSLFLEDGVLKQRGIEENPFRLGLNGDPGIFLSGSIDSVGSVAGLIFQDANIELMNSNSNSFVIEANSFVRARRILVSGSPIKQASSLTDIDDLAKIEGQIDSGFVRSTRAAGVKRPMTAFIKMRDEQRMQLQHRLQPPKPKSSIAIKEARKKARDDKQKLSKPHKVRSGKKIEETPLLRSFDLMKNDVVNEDVIDTLSSKDFAELTRQIVAPAGDYIPPDFKDMNLTMRQNGALVPFVENRRFIRCTVNEFSHDKERGFNLLMDGTTLNQAVGAPITLVGTRSVDLLKEYPALKKKSKDIAKDQALLRAVVKKIEKSSPSRLDGELPPLHIINVKGLNNVINVTGQITIGRDTLHFDDTAPTVLIFNFVEAGDIPRIVLEKDTIINVPKNSSIIFRGRGEVILGNGAEINLGGESLKKIDSSTRTEIITGIDGRATLGLFDKAVLKLQAPTTQVNKTCAITGVTVPKAYITGVGTIFIDGGASINIDNFGSLTIAPHGLVLSPDGQTSHRTIEQLPDDIIVEVRSTGEIRTGIVRPNEAILSFLNKQAAKMIITPQTATARVLTGMGNSNWRFERDGKITIRRNGRFEFNNDGSAPARLLDGTLLTRGHVRELTLTGEASIFIGSAGRLVLGPNADLATNTEKTFLVDFEPIRISGTGSVEFVDVPGQVTRTGVYTGFVGQLQSPTEESLVDEAMTMFRLAKRLTSINPNLSVAIEYIDGEDGLRKVRTRDGISVTLQDGDVLLSENTNLQDTVNVGKISGKNGTKNFVIFPNGTRSN